MISYSKIDSAAMSRCQNNLNYPAVSKPIHCVTYVNVFPLVFIDMRYLLSYRYIQTWVEVSNLSYLFYVTSHQVEKRKCNTATCATQRLANFLIRSSNNLGAILSPTNVGSNTYGKRNTVEILNKEPLNYLPL